jgi:hypothetical protein
MSFPEEKKEELFYYFALYHHLAMATGYLTILVLMLSVGVLLSTSSTAVRKPSAAVAVVFVLWGIEMYLVARMKKYSTHVIGCVGDDRVKKLETIPHNRWMTTSIGATLAAIWNILLLLRVL